MPSQQLTIGFDADDTLWHNERFFRLTEARFTDLLRDHAEPDQLSERLLAAERRNLAHYGFGVKGFVLSMIETAIDVTEARVPAAVIADIVSIGREMLAHPVELLPHARKAVTDMRDRGEIVLITKGDLLHQESKLARSGLGDLFDAVEIVSDKTPATYSRIFARHGGRQGVMIGNSLKSDVIPAIEAGGWGIHVPFDLTWDLEHAEAPTGHPRFATIPDLSHLVDMINRIARSLPIQPA
jgi:putative hydrolase of the HAD superfamily